MHVYLVFCSPQRVDPYTEMARKQSGMSVAISLKEFFFLNCICFDTYNACDCNYCRQQICEQFSEVDEQTIS